LGSGGRRMEVNGVGGRVVDEGGGMGAWWDVGE